MTAVDQETTTVEQNKATVRRIFEEISNETRRCRAWRHLIEGPATSGWFQASRPHRVIRCHDNGKQAGSPRSGKPLDDPFSWHPEAITVGKRQHLPLTPLETHV